MVSTFDLGWLVGILEGEGCFTLNGSANNKQPMILMQSTDSDIVYRVASILGGGGFVSGNKRVGNTYGNKIIYRYGIGGVLSIYWMKILREYMSERRKSRIDEILKVYNSMPRRKSKVVCPNIEGITMLSPIKIYGEFINPFDKKDVAS